MTTQHIEIDGLEVHPARCVVRWTNDDGKAIPSLYLDGKRVVKPWSIQVNGSMPADPFGGNGNTQ